MTTRTVVYNERSRTFRRALLVAAALAACGGSMSTAAAFVRHVDPCGVDSPNNCLGNPCRTIGYAITTAVAGDQILVGLGTYPERGLVIPVGLTISGAGRGGTIVDALRADRAFTVAAPAAAVTISDLTIRNGRAPSKGDGGAILVTGGSLDLLRVEITTSSATDGGAVSCAAGCAGLAVEQSALTENVATVNGGAIATVADTFVETSTLSDNTGESSGGAIDCSSGALLRVHDSELVENAAQYDGGGVHSVDCTTKLERDALIQNGCGGSGAGVFVSGSGELVVMNTTFSNNIAGSAGGAVSDQGPALPYIGNTTMVDNVAVTGNDIDAMAPLTMSNSILTHPNSGAGPFLLSADVADRQQQPHQHQLQQLLTGVQPRGRHAPRQAGLLRWSDAQLRAGLGQQRDRRRGRRLLQPARGHRGEPGPAPVRPPRGRRGALRHRLVRGAVTGPTCCRTLLRQQVLDRRVPDVGHVRVALVVRLHVVGVDVGGDGEDRTDKGRSRPESMI